VKTAIGLAAVLFLGASSLAFADGDGAVTGAAGGAIAGAVVGGPIGAAVGGVAGAVIGGTASGPGQAVVVQPAPCASSTSQMQHRDGSVTTTQRTDCPP
jgi:hypothetical protein